MFIWFTHQSWGVLLWKSVRLAWSDHLYSREDKLRLQALASGNVRPVWRITRFGLMILSPRRRFSKAIGKEHRVRNTLEQGLGCFGLFRSFIDRAAAGDGSI